MTEKEYFEKLDELTTKRNSLITSHFGSAFLQEYMDAGERIWYSKYDIPMNSSKSLFHEIVLDKDQNEIIDINPYITTFK